MKITQVLNLSNDDYHNSEEYKDYWSSSNLKNYIVSPREALYQKTKEKDAPSPQMVFGSQIHDFLASKHIRGQKFEWNVFEPPINPTTKEPYGKISKAYQDAILRVNNPISSNDMELIHDIWDMIRNSGYGWYFEQNIISKGIAEASYFVDAGIHKFKYRPDVLTENIIFDYKTINKSQFNEHGIAYVIKDRGYDISASMYQDFEHERTGIWKPFYIVWIMKEPPFDVLIHDISDRCFETFGKNEVIVNNGAMTWRKIRDQHELCQTSNQWPGYANKFDCFNGARIKQSSLGFDNYFDNFEIDD